MDNILGVDRLRLLPTKRNYKKFDDQYGKCEGINFYTAAKEELRDFGGFPMISDKILNAVCYVYNESKTSNFDDDICKFLYFWLGNTLINSLKKTEFFSEVIIKLFNRLNENKDGKICKIPHISMKENDFQKIKLIFDYSQDYVNYSLDLAAYNRSCNEEYNEYLTRYVDNYKKIHKECKSEHPQHTYCEEFLKYYDDKKHENLLTWSCKLSKTLPKAVPLKGEPQDGEQKARLDENLGRGGVQQPLQQTNERVQAHEQIPGLLTPNPTMPETDIVSTTPDGTSPTIISKTVTGAVSVAGALVPSYLLYNYTPAGNLINKLLGRTTRMNYNRLTEEQLMNNFYQPEGFNSERRGYNISYRPV
ncbi:PIR protein [Plasmodium vivax]|nr:PIR protein [Plasmodium vivax]